MSALDRMRAATWGVNRRRGKARGLTREFGENGDENGYGNGSAHGPNDVGSLPFYVEHPILTLLGATGVVAATIVVVAALTAPKDG